MSAPTPDVSEQLRAAVARHCGSGDRAAAVLAVTDTSKFVTNGHVDEARLSAHLSALFGEPGQVRSGGDAGKAEAARRFGTRPGDTQPTPSFGAAGAAEAQRRFGKRRV